jgi:hypothetical protein
MTIPYRKAQKREWYEKNRASSIEQSKAWRLANKERHDEAKRAWALRNPEKVKNTITEYRWKKRGIIGASIELYNNLLEAQGGVCAICQAPPNERQLSLDHDHSTGKPRGLLCNHCNYVLSGLEKIYRDPELLKAALRYLGMDQPHHTPFPSR